MTGGRVAFDVWFGPLKRRWVAEMGSAMPGRQFVDRQVEGPFASWEHVHRFVPIDEGRSELIDHIEYSLPAGGLTDAVGEGPAGKHALAPVPLPPRAHAARPRAARRVGRPAAAHGGDRRGERPRRLAPRRLPDHRRPPGRPAGAQQGRRARRGPVGPGRPGPSTTARSRASTRSSTLAGVNARRRLDAGPEEGHPRQPRPDHADARRGGRAHGPAAVQAFVSVSAVGAYGSRGDEIVTEQTPLGDGVPRRRLPRVGGGRRAGGRRRRPGGDPAVRHRAQRCAAGRSRAMLPAFKAGLGATLGDGEPVLVVGGARRPARRLRVDAARRGAGGRRQRDRAGAADQPRGHEDARQACCAVRPCWRRRRFLLRHGHGRHGRRDAAGQPARAARAAAGARVPLRVPRARGRAALRARARS